MQTNIENAKKEIDKLALVVIKDNRLLCAKSKGKELFYIPGGKRDLDETNTQALIREIKEELSVDISDKQLSFLGEFVAQADGKPQGVNVSVRAYFIELIDEPFASSEIESVAWISPNEKNKCSIVTQKIINWLVEHEYLHLELKSNYEWVFFDADNTLFHFDDFLGLKTLFQNHEIEFTKQHYEEYKTINKPLWIQYQNGELTAEQIQQQRFTGWSEKTGQSAFTLNEGFLLAMAETAKALDGAYELLTLLKQKKINVGIITNGFNALHKLRLEKTGFNKLVDILVVSEMVGVAKPDQQIFEYAFKEANNPHKASVLMVGDTLHSDIVGGISFGIDTCWLNRHNENLPADITPRYEINSLNTLRRMFLKRRDNPKRL